MKREKLFQLPVIGKYIQRRIIAKEGGDKTSPTLRSYTKARYNVDVDLYSYGGCFAPDFNTGGSVKVGRYCSFAQNVHFFGAAHPIDRASSSPYFYNKKWSGMDVEDVPRSTLTVGHDVWIGFGSIITPGCKHIGNGAVIGAGAVVTKDVPPYTIVAGTPARFLKYRFPENVVELLEKSRWWELTPEALMEFYPLMKDPEAFAKAVIAAQK